MTGACTIDGTDIATLGVLILRGGDWGFISFPDRKSPNVIEWPDQDGFEIGDDAPVFAEKRFTVNYYLKGDETNFKNRIEAFIGMHFQTGYRSIYVREFDTTFQLRFAKVSSFSINRGFTLSGLKSALISIDYVMDNPVQFLDPGIVVPTAQRPFQTHVTIGGVDLSAFGIIVTNVYPSAFARSAKEGLVFESNYQTGLVVDTSLALKKDKQLISVKCTMITADRAAFLSNYNALWNKLALASLTLGLSAATKTYKAYYSGMTNFKKRAWTDRAFAEFELLFYGYEL